MKELQGKRAIVTGGSRGIGKAIAETLARAGAKVVITARHGDAAEETAAVIRAEGGEALALSCDVADAGAVERLFGDVEKQWGGLDILINNAGIIDPIGHIWETDPDSFARLIAININGVYHCARAAIPLMRANGKDGGNIVNISSGAAHRPIEGWSAYCTSKAAVAMLTRCIDLEAGPAAAPEAPVRVFGFAPGTVETDMMRRIRQAGLGPVAKIPAEAHGPAEAVGQAVAYLCTQAAADLAGQEIDIRMPDLRRRVGLPPLS